MHILVPNNHCIRKTEQGDAYLVSLATQNLQKPRGQNQNERVMTLQPGNRQVNKIKE
jgi:hypothetical protein